VWKKLRGWKEKSLSFEGRGVLIRAVAQAIPTYIMSCFLLPKALCDKIESEVCSFWWGGTKSKRKVHWTKKDSLFRSKHEGGMGFKTLREFNLAMLAKQVWRLHTNTNSLIAQCYKARYYPNLDIIHASSGNNPNFALRKGAAGELGLGPKSTSGKIIGSQLCLH
jgi:hypothetical protein